MKTQKSFIYITDNDQFDEAETGGGRLPEQGFVWYRSDIHEIKVKQNGQINTLFGANGKPPSLKMQHTTITKTFTDFAIADTTKQVVLLPLPMKAELISINAECTVAWNGPAVVTVSIGRAQTPIELLLAQDLKTTGFKDSLGDKLKLNRGMYSSSSNTDIIAELKSIGGNLDTATQGSITFYLSWIEY